ncbi:hypothetical protein HYH02_011804 [Chlamydomonas schloesseri]|uniref:Uncharacterized protein n=1 Tax=Chlamydomonas schloesseri TaxID=2026947 RepID=A0A835TAV0_9CHLO|nr:hypothetical protein HYH02_011804 [Chlamydomonas schloesseri]|eukprot:KAG2435510.1 hypothetical protein HYH02_011804 [Chlamydomonas schloesseri]
MVASDDAPAQTAGEDSASVTEAHDSASAPASAGAGAEASARDEWGEALNWELVEAPGSASAATEHRLSSPQSHQLASSTAPEALEGTELEQSASEACVAPSSGTSSPTSASDAHEESDTEEEANLRRGRQLADTLAAAESVTEPVYDLALALGEGALAAALEGRAEPFPPLEESEEERDAFEAEFQRVLAEMGQTK